jgi:glycosyltransferase involved in cell wall biosynthesis
MTLAISNQIPVVAAASGPLFEELADTLVVVPPSDHEALAEEIIRLLEDKQYRKILTDKYQKYIVDHDWSLVVRAIYEEYVKGAQLKQRFNK